MSMARGSSCTVHIGRTACGPGKSRTSVDSSHSRDISLGIRPLVTEWSRPVEAEYDTLDELVGVTRRRLCLPGRAAGEVREALLDLGVAAGTPPDLGSSGRQLVTLDWHPDG
jgi:hypothetical protein